MADGRVELIIMLSQLSVAAVVEAELYLEVKMKPV